MCAPGRRAGLCGVPWGGGAGVVRPFSRGARCARASWRSRGGVSRFLGLRLQAAFARAAAPRAARAARARGPTVLFALRHSPGNHVPPALPLFLQFPVGNSATCYVRLAQARSLRAHLRSPARCALHLACSHADVRSLQQAARTSAAFALVQRDVGWRQRPHKAPHGRAWLHRAARDVRCDPPLLCM